MCTFFVRIDCNPVRSGTGEGRGEERRGARRQLLVDNHFHSDVLYEAVSSTSNYSEPIGCAPLLGLPVFSSSGLV